MHLTLWTLTIGLGVALYASAAVAQDEPLVTDRPDFTESALTVPAARVQLEAGATLARSDDEDELTLGEPLIRWGLRPDLELRVEAPSWIDGPDGAGFGDPGLGFKLALPPFLGDDLALIAATTIPLGDDDVGQEGWHPEAVLAASWELSPALVLASNVGATTTSVEEDRQLLAWTSLSLGASLAGSVGGFIEAFGFVEDDDAGPVYVDGGLTRLLGNDFQLDVRLGAGLFQAAGDWFLGAGASRRF